MSNLLSSSSAFGYLLLDIGLFHLFPYCSILCIQFFPARRWMSSHHLVYGRLLLLRDSHDLHCTRVLVHLRSSLATWPAHCHFSLATRSITSLIPVLLLISSFRTRSLRLIPNIALSTTRWQTLRDGVHCSS